MELGQSYLNLPSTLPPQGAAQTDKVPFFTAKVKEGRQKKPKNRVSRMNQKSEEQSEREAGLYSGGATVR